MLEAANVSVTYGQHHALTDASLSVGRSEIVVILGANGAGKTSLLKAIAGIVACLPGKRVTLSGRDIAGLPAHEIVEERRQEQRCALGDRPDGRRECSRQRVLWKAQIEEALHVGHRDVLDGELTRTRTRDERAQHPIEWMSGGLRFGATCGGDDEQPRVTSACTEQRDQVERRDVRPL